MEVTVGSVPLKTFQVLFQLSPFLKYLWSESEIIKTWLKLQREGRECAFQFKVRTSSKIHFLNLHLNLPASHMSQREALLLLLLQAYHRRRGKDQSILPLCEHGPAQSSSAGGTCIVTDGSSGSVSRGPQEAHHTVPQLCTTILQFVNFYTVLYKCQVCIFNG